MLKLDRLVNVLGGYGARLWSAPASRDVALRSVVVHDPTDPRAATGDVFLAVGVESAAEAVRLARAARATVVLVRESTALAETALAETALAETALEKTALNETALNETGLNETALDETGLDESAETALAEARDGGVAVLLVDPEVSWSQLFGVVYGLVLEGRETEAGRGPTDLFAFADTLAGELGYPVTIEDQMSRVLAYSGSQQTADPVRLETILGRRVSEAMHRLLESKGVFAHLAVSDEPLFVEPSPAHGLRGRMVVAVRAGRELLGSIWVECEQPLAGGRSTALADGARAVALHLLRSRVSADLERRVESDLVIQLLEGTADVSAVISRLGLPGGQFRVIALQAHIAEERHAAILLAFERATTGFGWSRPGRSALFGNTLYTVLPSGGDVSAALDWLAAIVGVLPRRVTVLAGVGGPATPAHLPASRQEADESLALRASRPEGGPVVYDESWDEILLQRLRAAASAGRAPARGPVADLTRHDAEHGTRYIETLRAWLEAQGDLAVAAGRLGVHPNTVRYRLRKMAAVTNLRLDLPEKRLAMIIALAVHQGG
ncbi:PucR family transcriptional regulator [Nonomuraea cavernae]|uniref:DNA-binding protein n=1 Tax=Nonomuraea cavernae TaxID=2045107 RepID=A0A918DFE6_9ACTN|nr:PucR family transcriptional regulator [Nonomuraea cavernae]MCA2183677.1 helix-turn-helix domain-containing protein [Nonomuraea cavernae]GGO61030.1 DNA-binding protein [Nonomuraea cavernae]